MNTIYIDQPTGPYGDTRLPDGLTPAAKARVEKVIEDFESATCDSARCETRIGYYLEVDLNGHDYPAWYGFAVTDDGRAICEDCDSEKRDGMTTTYFTFGYDHRLPGIDGTAMPHYVQVDHPKNTDARAIFTAWLGSNQFAFEYPEYIWVGQNLARHYPNPPTYVLTLSVETPGDEG